MSSPSKKSPARKSKAAARRPKKPAPAPEERRAPRWTFLSNHAHVLLCLARQPDARLREVAAAIGITERAVQKLLVDLEAEGLLERHREGRRNSYELHLNKPLRHPLEASHEVRELVNLLLED